MEFIVTFTITYNVAAANSAEAVSVAWEHFNEEIEVAQALTGIASFTNMKTSVVIR